MKPYDNPKLPIEFKYDMEMMKLLAKSKELYGKYNAIILHQPIDPLLVLKPFIKQESFKSHQLSRSEVAQSSLYYMQYNEITDDVLEINNYMNILLDVEKYISKEDKLSLSYINRLHRDLFVSKRGKKRNPGHLRSNIMWIGPRGAGIERAEYVPVAPENIEDSMKNFIKYFNRSFSVDILIDIAISHAQFENIHPYRDGNGRIGRILIPIQTYLKDSKNITLFLSEAIKADEYSYYNRLSDTRCGKWKNWIKFFLEMIIKQLNNNIHKLIQIRKVHDEDKPLVLKLLKEKNGIIFYNYLFSNITTTIKEASDYLDIDYQTCRNYLKKLFEIGMLSKHKIYKGEFVYTYIKMYNIHVPVEWL